MLLITFSNIVVLIFGACNSPALLQLHNQWHIIIITITILALLKPL
jgi:hypothetical protein